MGLFRKSKEKKQHLLNWQKVIMVDSPDKLVMTEQELKRLSHQRAENDLRIAQDCNTLINETVKPDVFFTRLELLKEKSADLQQLEPYIDFSGALPSAALEEIVEKEQEAIKLFLIKYFTSVYDKSMTLKTERGKKNQYQKFYDSLQPFYSKMNGDNIDYVETKYKAYIR